MSEIYRTSLYTDVPQEELRLVLSSHTVSLRSLSGRRIRGYSTPGLPAEPAPVYLGPVLRGRLLPGHLYETIAGAGLSGQVMLQLHLLSDPGNRRAGTQPGKYSPQSPGPPRFHLPGNHVCSVCPGGKFGETHTIRIGPTLWSAFMKTLEKLAHVIADD